jgi:hypothetical protein
MLHTIFGIPSHPLIVHATVVVVPLAALTSVLAVAWPRFRRWFGWGTAALPALALILDPLATQSGESLEHALPRTPLIEQHAHLADGLLPWLIGLLASAAAFYWLDRRRDHDGRPSRALVNAVGVLVVITAVGTLVEVVLIGHSGATAAWSGIR